MADFLHRDGVPDPEISMTYAVCVACVARERGMGMQGKRDDIIEKSGGTVYKAARRWLMQFKPK